MLLCFRPWDGKKDWEERGRKLEKGCFGQDVKIDSEVTAANDAQEEKARY